MSETKPCAQCGEAFIPRKRTDRPAKFCSRACLYIAASNRVVNRCEGCGEEYAREPSHLGRFCSKACRADFLSRVEAKVCIVCGAQFGRGRSASGRLVTRAKFATIETCSKRCGSIRQSATLKSVNDAEPGNIGERTLVARTCDRCGELKMPGGFRPLKSGRYLTHVCELCHSTRTRATAIDSWRQAIGKAHRYREQWTGPELEIAMRDDLSLLEAALMIGRTPSGVKHARAKVRHDPKWIAVAGL